MGILILINILRDPISFNAFFSTYFFTQIKKKTWERDFRSMSMRATSCLPHQKRAEELLYTMFTKQLFKEISADYIEIRDLILLT